MFRLVRLTVGLLAACLLLTACGSSDGPSAAESTPTAEATKSESPSESPSAEATGPVAKFDVTARCPVDRAASGKVTGAPLSVDKMLKPRERRNKQMPPEQGFACALEGPKGIVETSVITEPALVERRKGLDFTTIAPCVVATADGGWDKAWTCDLPNGHGPVLLRNGTDSVFTCYTASKGPKPAAVANGRAVCDAVLAAVGG